MVWPWYTAKVSETAPFLTITTNLNNNTMSNILTGRLQSITPIQQLTTRAGKPFQKREVILDNSFENPITGDLFENIVCFELVGEKCATFEAYTNLVGQVVDVEFAVNGRNYTDQQGQTKYSVSLRPLGITPHVAKNAPQAPQTAPQATQPRPVAQQPIAAPQAPQGGYQPSPELEAAVYKSVGQQPPQQYAGPQQQGYNDLPF